MRKLLPVLLLLFIPLVFPGCSSKSDESAPPKISAPIDNNAAEAKGAGAAPTDPSIVYPGQGLKGKPKR
jgi:hypothetical protein